MGYLVPLLQVAVVFAIFGATMWWLKRHGARTRGTHPEHVTVVATAPIGRSASVAVVRVGDQTFALGVTEGAVHTIGAVTLPDPEPAAAPAEAACPGGSAVQGLPAGFWDRFTAAAAAQGPAPATLVAGARYLATALRRARGGTEQADPAAFAAVLAAAAPRDVPGTARTSEDVPAASADVPGPSQASPATGRAVAP